VACGIVLAVALGMPAFTLVDFVVYLVVAGICGSVARAFGGGTGGGFLVSIVLGFVGAFVGTWMARAFHLPRFWVVAIDGRAFPIVWSVVGGMVLVMLSHALTRRYVM
jgi:uncharacterized membrane protein YeaQ/YmgE (transglycosylase-associated protein family)